MATGWLISLQCKSKVVDDVIPHRRESHHSASCRKTIQSLKEVVDPTRQTKPGMSKLKQQQQPEISKHGEKSGSRKSAGHVLDQPTTRVALYQNMTTRVSNSGTESYFPALTELPEGHSSRNVVEIIFQTSWSSPKGFSGRVEMVFKVQHLSRSVTRFEEYREIVKSRAVYGGEVAAEVEVHARCVADGNEVMRFLCLGSTNGGAYDVPAISGGGGDNIWALKGARVITFSCSSEAHHSTGGGRGRRAMLVCRVIAGRVRKQLGFKSLVNKGQIGYESVSGENGELIVFDSRAVLPCFLIVYRL